MLIAIGLVGAGGVYYGVHTGRIRMPFSAPLPQPVASLDLTGAYDTEFLAHLRTAGVFDAAAAIGLDAETWLAPLSRRADNPYRRYRWSVTLDDNDTPVINALPPEEEVGWTPWERWYSIDGKPVHESLAFYPLQVSIAQQTARWFALEDSKGLAPRAFEPPKTLEAALRLARVDAAALDLDLDFEAVFIKPLSEAAQENYRHYRWVVINHIIADGRPVIYAFPPMHRAATRPWESWQTDSEHTMIHRVYYAARNPRTTGEWREGDNAPQRPPEVFGVTWYWYTDPSPKPALASEGAE